METSMTTKQENNIALPQELQGSWGTEEVTSDDYVIAKLLLMHGQSEMVLDGKASLGDFVKSTDHTILGNAKDVVKVVPFMMYKTWVTNELVGKKYEWRSEEPMTASNSDKPWDYYMYDNKEYPIDTTDKNVLKNGVMWRRDRSYNFYAQLVSDLEEGKTRLPIRLQFKRTSWKTGKQIASFFSECAMDKLPPAIKQWEISNEVIKGDENTYLIFKAAMGENTKIEHIHKCKEWYLEMTKHANKYTNDNSEEEVATTEASVDGNNEDF